MVSLTYHDEHRAWQQRVQKEINEAFKLQSTYPEPSRPCFSPPRARKEKSATPRSRGRFYSALPAANINLSALNVYAEVRGKYSRNAYKTLNSLPQVNGLVSRPSTAGSLTGYNRKALNEEKKIEAEEKEEKKTQRPLNEKRVKILPVKKDELIEADLKEDQQDGDPGQDGKENEEIKEEELEEGQNKDLDQDKNSEITEASFKTSSSQKRYIEELEKLLREERVKRIKAEEILEKLSSSKSRKLNKN